MIHELLGVSAAGILSGETKISISSEGFLQTCLSPCPSTSTPPPSAATSAAAAAPSNPDTQNLRCPRCDSTNTKFCYYNNYNLTQPRHFCKTCRRYWTKGGALRNVPIGGGCRKNRAVSSVSTAIGKSSTSKIKSTFEKTFSSTGFDHELSQSNHPLLWSPPQNSHILALLRSAQNPNPNPNPNPLNGVPYPPSAGVSTALWRNNHQQNGVVACNEVQNSGIQELFQRLKSPTGGYYNGHQPLSLNNAAVSSSNHHTSAILESAPVAAADFSYFNPPYSWSDVATPSGAYP